MQYPSRPDAALIMIRDARIFYEHGWLMGTSGNLSIRTSERAFLITASGRDKGRLESNDFLLRLIVDEVDAGQNSLDHKSSDPQTPVSALDLSTEPGFLPADRMLKPSAETSIHQAIYRKVPDAGAIYHVHELYSALCSERDADATTFRGIEMIKGLGIWEPEASAHVPIFANHADVPRIAREVERFLAKASVPAEAPDMNSKIKAVPAVNIRGHGFYAWGRDAFEAKRHVETLAYLYRYSWKAMSK